METSENPFDVLGIAPTGNPSAIRRAYFAAVQRHPPHADANAFRRLRAAYESLATPSGRSAALVLAPVDIASELGPLRQRFDAALEEVTARVRASAREREIARRFAEHVSRLPWVEAARLGDPS